MAKQELCQSSLGAFFPLNVVRMKEKLMFYCLAFQIINFCVLYYFAFVVHAELC